MTLELVILSSIDSYKEAIKSTIRKDYDQAEELFHETLSILEKDEEKFDPRVWSTVLQK